MWKVTSLIHDYGLLCSLYRIFRALPNRLFAVLCYTNSFLYMQTYARRIDQILHENSYCYIDLFDVSFGWRKGLFQRPQQIANALANHDVLVFYSMNIFEKDRYLNPIQRIKDNLYYIDYKNPVIRKLIYNKIKLQNIRKIYHVYSTNHDYTYLDLVEKIDRQFTVVYEFIDSMELSREIRIKERHNEILRDSRIIIFATSRVLLNEVVNYGHINSLLVENGVDFIHWSKSTDNGKKNEIESRFYDYNVGYFGALAPDWFDYDLLRYLAINNLNMQFTIIGPLDYSGPSGDSPMDYVSKFEDIKNISFLGKVEYDILPEYANKFDVCIIPFKINNITLATSPIKLYEYLSMGKPVVTTEMPECTKHDIVFHSKDYYSFSENLLKACATVGNFEYVDKAKNLANEYSWDRKVAEMLQYLKKQQI